jgi:membrane protein implicated in regulation of membrane protease activity
MNVSPSQQNRALLIALAVNVGFVLAMLIAIAAVNHSWDSMPTLLLVAVVYLAILAAGLFRYWRRAHRRIRHAQQWMDSAPDAEGR